MTNEEKYQLYINQTNVISLFKINCKILFSKNNTKRPFYTGNNLYSGYYATINEAVNGYNNKLNDFYLSVGKTTPHSKMLAFSDYELEKTK